ncbi:MAG: Short-chain-fatty-acid--CoA ligase [Alphaproteobacteria bacterium MarineAlpha4_Bin2]|nr:MAG: Short-chain-fatty-acid--CoA ligase [Alphaproteobacteria bacterium MarineAlpha4_Bin2]
MKIKPLAGRHDPARIEEAYRIGYWRNELIIDLLAKHARERPDALAIVDGDHRLTWFEFHLLSQRFALHLRRLGIGAGDVVALQMPNWAEYLVCYHGVRFVGAILVQVGADWRRAEMAYGYSIGPAKVAIVPRNFGDFDYPSALQNLKPELPGLEHIIVARGAAPKGTISLDGLLEDPIEARVSVETLVSYRPSPDEVIRIVFTSGTTGLPKAIMHTDNTLGHSGRITQADFGHDENDVIMMFVPFSTNYGSIMGLQLPLNAGATLVLMDHFSASGALELIGQEKVTYVPATPTHFIAMTNSPAMESASVESIRLMLSAGAAFPVQSIKEMREKFQTMFIDSFGMNEFGMGLWAMPDDDPDKVAGTIGRPITGVDAQVLGTDGQRVAPGEIGELVIKSAGMCAGYHNQPEANATAWDNNGWFRSGDLAIEDELGLFRIAGRSKDVIIRGGANVSPREIEEILIQEPRIREASVIGLPDDYYGETVCACVIAKPGEQPTTAEINAYLKPKIASYKLPSRTVMLEEFPLNSMGKVRKDMLVKIVLSSTELE